MRLAAARRETRRRAVSPGRPILRVDAFTTRPFGGNPAAVMLDADGLSDDQIVELTASIAYENFRARFDHALGIGSDGLYVCAWPPPDGHPKATP